ncbi:hypothetical protein Tsubulata_035842 [Turnera subulata]|uniref:Ribosomal RNA-processing protein 12-like conserved domain-containing protein n=1 Tax=Turnera subulata TaxID=218843 RepID=A0A9Q0FVU9_9ROSI|nr:hypothetical protein Tsubulata_035842 [Turnera subulata]
MKPKGHRDRGHGTTEEPEAQFKDDAEICQQLMSRYSTSTAPQHRHLLATSAAIRSILSADSIPLTPSSYFAAAIHNLSSSKTLDSTAVSALVSFLTIVAPLVPEKGIDGDKATEAVGVLVRVVKEREEGLGVATVRGVVKCLGILVLGFCELEDWGSVKEGFETLLDFSLDKRPKVRRSAQECVEKVFKSLKSANVIKEASKLVLLMLNGHMPVAFALIKDGSKDDALSKPEHLEVLHMLNLLNAIVPHLSVKVSSAILSELLKLTKPKFSALTKHVFKTFEAILKASSDEVIGPQLENIINSLSVYMSRGKKNPVDTLISASILSKTALDKLHGSKSWKENFPKVCSSVTGFLNYDTNTASQASDIAKDLINGFVDEQVLSSHRDQFFDDAGKESEEAELIKATCAALEKCLSACDGIPNEHLLGVISFLFRRLGDISHFFMKNVVLKVADLMNHAGQDTPETTHLQNCIGSAVVAMGPERILALVPITMDANSLSCSNAWLVPILKTHVVGASLGYYMEHIVPLAKSLERAGQQVKKSVIRQDLQACAHGLLGLLPAFCHYPVDAHKKLGSLCELLITFLKDSCMHQNVAIALQVFVNQNKSVLISKTSAGESNSNAPKDSVLERQSLVPYSNKIAKKNIKALASCCHELLRALADLFVDSASEKRQYIKDAIGCLASITDSSVTKNIFKSLLLRFQFVNSGGEFEVLGSRNEELVEKKPESLPVGEKDVQRCVMMELASSLIVGASEDLTTLIYNFIVYSFQATDMVGHCEAYFTLSRILEEQHWFCSSRFVEVVDLLLGLKSPADFESLRQRFACFRILMVQALEISLEEENTKAFLILNEIILTLKDGNDEARKVAYDALLLMSSSLRNSPSVSERYQKLISMILGYISGSSPHITSGAVSALSILVIVILEIMIRKCGSAAVELVSPEKYKGFLKKVWENRQHQSTSKEADRIDMETADSSAKRPEKRRHKQLGHVVGENGSKNSKRRKREKQQNDGATADKGNRKSTVDGGGLKRAKGARHLEHKSPIDSQKEVGGRKRQFNKGHASGGKRKMEHRNMNKGERPSSFRPGSASKSQKSKRAWKKQKTGGQQDFLKEQLLQFLIGGEFLQFILCLLKSTSRFLALSVLFYMLRAIWIMLRGRTELDTPCK